MDQPQLPNSLFAQAPEILWVLVAMIGGVARSLDGYLSGNVFPGVAKLVAHGFVSGFSGYMVAQVLLRLSPDWALIGAGIGGYLGTQGLDWITLILKERFGGKSDGGSHS